MMKQLLDQEMPVAAPAAVPAWQLYAKRAAGLITIAGISLLAYWLTAPHFFKPVPTGITAFAIPMLPAEGITDLSSIRADRPTFDAAPPPLQPAVAVAKTRIPSTTNAAPSLSATANDEPSPEQARKIYATDRRAERSNSTPTAIQKAAPTRAALALLPTLGAKRLAVATPGLSAAEMQFKVPTSWAYGVEAGLGTVDFSAAQAWSLAAFLQMPIGENTAWYTRISAGYQQFRQARTVEERTFLFSSTRSSSSVGAVPLNARTQLTQLDYLYLLPQVGYTLHARFSVEAGLQYAHLIRSQSATEWSLASAGQAPTPSDNQEEKFWEELPERLSANQPSALLRRQQFAMQLGLRYRIDRHLSISAQWQQGFSNIYEGSVRSARNRFLQASVSYRWR